MKISVLIKTKSRETRVEKIDDNNFVVKTKEMPIEGKANESVIKILAIFFNIAPSRIQIISGKRSKRKIVKIE